jgi:sirohydrochlorin cobaltochelatase
MSVSASDKRAPMAAAPMKYADNGSVDWGNMWDSFCALALDGGPPHRGTMLHPGDASNPTSPAYRFASGEVCRGIGLVSGLHARDHAPGWVAVECVSAAQARWLRDAVLEENVAACCEGKLLLLPVGADYRLEYEIKNVVTATAKTTHYWREHLPAEVKQTLALQIGLEQVRRWIGW